ncbi:MAG: hypothetical protein ACPHUJ_11320 [Pseudomonadales bacterium]
MVTHPFTIFGDKMQVHTGGDVGGSSICTWSRAAAVVAAIADSASADAASFIKDMGVSRS